MSNFFLGIYDFFAGRKLLFYISLGLFLALLVWFASKVKLQENFTQMLPHDKNSVQLNKFLKGSKFTDRIMVCVSQADTSEPAEPDSLVTFADGFVTRLKSRAGDYIQSLEYTNNDTSTDKMLAVIDENLPLFLEEEDYASLDSVVTEEGIAKRLRYNLRTLTGPTGMVMKKFILKDPLGLNFIAYKKLRVFAPDEQMELYDNHFMTKDKRNLFLFIDPRHSSSETSQNTKFFLKMDELISESTVGKNLTIVYFGAPVVAAGNAKQIRQDTILTTSFTLLLLVLIVALFFRKFSAPLLVILPVVCGALFALAAIYFLKGEISIIAVAAGSLVLGIAVNYSLHFLTHFRFHPDVRGTIKELAFPMTLGSVTTIGGFLCLQFVQAPVLRDLGLFAALSLIGAALSSLIILPHFISKKAVVVKDPTSLQDSLYERLLLKLQSNRYFVWTFVLLTPVFLYFATGVEFESDMNKINYISPKTKEAEKVINRFSAYYQKSIFIVSRGNSLEEALAGNERTVPLLKKMQAEGKISSFAGVSTLILSRNEQLKRIERWNAYWSGGKGQKVLSTLTREGQVLQFKESAFTPFRNLMDKRFQTLSPSDVRTLEQMLLQNFIEEHEGTYSVIGLVKTSPENAKAVYSGLSVFPELIVFDRQYITDTLVKIVGEDFSFITWFSSILVFLALLLSYGRIELALITFIPMVVSWIWILGIMALIGIKFNIINIILSTLVFGLGDDYAIFTMDGLQGAYASGKKNLNSVRVSILFSALTTVVGLGVLVFAKHPALNSIAIVSIIGIVCVWLVSQTLQPVLFNMMIKNPTDKKHAPYTLWGLMKTVFAFSYFVFGALLLTVIGIILTKLVPVRRKRMKYLYHCILSKFTGSLVYIMPNVKKLIINERNENFSKPAVVIANHQSFLDILATAMLSPKLILLTNKWVWNSPVFGMVVRMADFYPVADGAGDSVERLRERVNEGYSIVVFPEGTRSVDGDIKRFHKGAFFLAEKLQIDVLPIVLHGTGYCMTKGEFLLKDGQITVKYLPRIEPSDPSFGANYSERAKLVGRYFRSEFTKLRREVETTSYFRTPLVSNFLFKGPVLEWYMKIKLRLEENYKVYDALLPMQGTILDLGCGYGFMSYMLGYRSLQRVVKGIDYDENKIEIAQHGYLKSANVSFSQGDLTRYSAFEPCDGIVISDVLHYLRPAEQVSLLDKCVLGLKPNGILLVRDGISDLEKRHQRTRLSEFFSTKLLKFNKTSGEGLSFISSQLIYDVAQKNGLNVSKIDNAKLTSNVIFVLKKQV